MLCLILFGLLQVSYLIMARDVISFTAFASARALAVGMSEEFVERVAHVTTIPTAGPSFGSGRMYNDSLGNPGTVGARWDMAVATRPGSDQFWYEHTIIPYYLGADDESYLDGMLNYHYWQSSDTEVTVQSSVAGSDRAEVTVRQNIPLVFPFAKVFFMDADVGMVYRSDADGGSGYDQVPIYEIVQSIYMENHSALYMTHE
jgi:hypothetical protein